MCLKLVVDELGQNPERRHLPLFGPILKGGAYRPVRRYVPVVQMKCHP